ncbi:MAG TPA: type II toxin-antitoxin system prevent-host-death family antitoxin, partial [Gemmatimonadaceae bacterium]|nr:type II toxin-antitoxin system prevent-host-death family antitoxin [Gemmatimonadaceae bacterium]
MPDEYSLYEAKAKLSALVRQVREGRTIVITVHGEPAAELRPVDRSARRQTLTERLEELESRGELTEARRKPGAPLALRQIAQQP